MTTPIRFGLFGTGRIGQVHARGIAESVDAELAWIADPFIEGAERVSRTYGGKVTSDPADVFTSGEIDAALIASPTPTHVDLIRAAVEAGVPVLCEKPIDLDISRVEALRPLVRSSGVPVALGFNRRFDPGFAEARRRTVSGEIGSVEQMTIISRDPAAPPSDYVAVSGGIFRDMTIHDFDMARFFLPEIVEVTAFGSTTFDEGARQHGDFDTTTALLRARSGALITIVNSRHSAVGYDQRIEVLGNTGQIDVANQGTSLVTVSGAAGVGVSAPFESAMFERYRAAYRDELAEFIKLVRGEESSSPTFDDGRAALLLADAAQLSATTGTAVAVDLGS